MSLRGSHSGALLTLITCLVLMIAVCDGAAQYQGCFGDGGPRALPFMVKDNSSMTVELCEALSRARGMSVWGLEHASQCFAGKCAQLQLACMPGTV